MLDVDVLLAATRRRAWRLLVLQARQLNPHWVSGKALEELRVTDSVTERRLKNGHGKNYNVVSNIQVKYRIG